ncbi:hypothetical protein ACFPRL_36050 [Pseudoclavibacter helvolus]
MASLLSLSSPIATGSRVTPSRHVSVKVGPCPSGHGPTSQLSTSQEHRHQSAVAPLVTSRG